MSGHDVVVIGAGPAGLTAARDLGDQGFDVLVLEARDRVGGRTFTRALEGYPDVRIEVGGTYIHPSLQHNLAAEISRYDQPLAEGLGELKSTRFHFRGELRQTPVPPDQLVAFERAVIAMAVSAQRINPLQTLADQHLADLDISTEQYLAPLGLPPETLEFLYAGIAAAVQCDVRHVSMLQWLGWMAGMGSPLSTFFGVTDEKLADGMSALWQAMADDTRAEFAFSQDVNAVVQGQRGVVVETVDGGSHAATLCVVAVPTQVLARIAFTPELDAQRRSLLDGLFVARGFKNFLVVEDAPRGFLGFGGYASAADPQLGWLFEDRELPDGRLLLIAWGNGPDLTSRPADAQRALTDYLPGAALVAVDGHDWTNDPYANGLNHFRRPGQALTFAASVGGRHGSVLFAGSDVTRTIWNGWVEGAVDSGRIAAREAAAALRAEARGGARATPDVAGA